MIIDSATFIGWLKANDSLSESLLHSLSLEKHGYSVQAVFRRIIDTDGNLLSPSYDVEVHLEAVDSLNLLGALMDVSVEHPEEVNWGFSEVSLVILEPEAGRYRLRVLWEGWDRKIEILCRRVWVSLPDHVVND
ncbi:hypothetical protein AB0N65_11605 [Paenarthrobacter sp. NPDC089322]|uniref:hypothetical protein n=1 Tax=Paenarthrobacter sp. NPDC089322 TaxID=3155065 RepID=UPI00341E3D5C